MNTIYFRNIPKSEMLLAEKYSPCIVLDELEPFPPIKVGITIFYAPQHPSSLLFYRIRNHRPMWKRIQDYVISWGLTFYHSILNDRKPLRLYKLYRNRPQPIILEIQDKWKKRNAKKVIEYAIFYDSDIVHLYDLEHVWMYLDKNDELIGIKGSRHGIIATQYPNKESIKYHKGHPILYSTPGKHSNISDLRLLNRKLLVSANTDFAGNDGIYPVQFFDDKLREMFKKIDPGKRKFREVYEKKFAYIPSFKFTKFIIPKGKMLLSWWDLMHWIPNRMIQFIEKHINNKRKQIINKQIDQTLFEESIIQKQKSEVIKIDSRK